MNATTKKIEQLRAQLTALETKQKDETRKLETRQKVVIGAAVMTEARRSPDFHKQLIELLQRNVTRSIDNQAVESWLSTT